MAPTYHGLADLLTAANGTWFGIDLTGVRLDAADTDWSWGNGQLVRADTAPPLTHRYRS